MITPSMFISITVIMHFDLILKAALTQSYLEC